MKFLFGIVFLLVAIGALGQQANAEKSNGIEYVIYGVYCGECVSGCAPMYKLTNDELLANNPDDFFKKYDAPDSERFVFNKLPLSREQFLKAKKIMDSIPEILLDSNSKVYGQPDNRDQCGIYIQLKMQGKVETFYIDTDLDAIPVKLRSYAELIMSDCNENQIKK